MNLIVDGVIYRFQNYGGISRIYDNILPRMCALDPNLYVTIFNRWEISRELPKNDRIKSIELDKYDNWLRPWRLWHKTYPSLHNYLLQTMLGSTKNKIWLSTYYSVPPFAWRGSQIVFAHDFIHELFPSLLPDSAKTIQKKKYSILNADAVICNSHATAQDMLNYYQVPEQKIFVAELGHDDIFKQRTNSEIGNKYEFPFILYLGRRKHYKGFDTLMAAYIHWEKRKEIKLLVVGPSWANEEENFIIQQDLQDDVILLCGIDDDHLCDLYNQAQTFVYPSLYEGFGIPLLEAMVCGCPVVASQIPSTKEVAQDIPYYFEPGDAVGLADALNEVVLAGRGSEQVERGLSRVQLYSWDQTARKVLNVLHHVAGNS